MRLQRVLSLVRRALDDYRMIQDGDRIAVGLSGGKDSLTLLYALEKLRAFYPHPFSLCAITVDLGFDNLDLRAVKTFCQKQNVPYEIVSTRISDIVFGARQETNPCSLCAKLRKGALNDRALSLGCNKIAYAHHQDDAVETLLLSLLYEGRFHSFLPVTRLDRTGLTVIRPLLYLKEADVIGFSNKTGLPVVKSPCPADGHTKREYVKRLVRQLNRENPGVKERLFTALRNGCYDAAERGNLQ